MKQVKSKQCILLTDVENPNISQIIIMLKENIVSNDDEAVEKSRAIVEQYMKHYHRKKEVNKKNVFLSLGCIALGLIIGFLI